MCSALGIHYSTPVNVTLVFAEDYIDAPWSSSNSPVKIDIDQKPNNEHFRLQFQTTEMAKKWIAANWEKYRDRKGPAASSSNSVNRTTSFQDIGKKFAKQETELLDMGFDVALVRYALLFKNGETVIGIHVKT